jgi:hypothetical protein
MTRVVFRDEGGNPVAGAVMAIMSGPAEQTEIGYVTDDEGGVGLTIPQPGSYAFALTAADGRRFTAGAQVQAGETIDVTVRAAA